MIELNEITVNRGKLTILQNVSWNVTKGEHWGILGLNGSGKTTLLKLITGYLWPTFGTATVLGKRYGSVSIQEARKKIGWVSTSLDDRFHDRPNDTVFQMVMSGLYGSVGMYDIPSKEEIERTLTTLETFQLLALKDQPFHTLSQGERKKTLLARAWVGQPDLYILDEPTTGLDLVARENLLETVNGIVAKRGAPTILYVTHHPEELQPFISHVLLLRGGEVVAAGKKEEVLTEKVLSEGFQTALSVETSDDRYWVRLKQ